MSLNETMSEIHLNKITELCLTIHCIYNSVQHNGDVSSESYPTGI